MAWLDDLQVELRKAEAVKAGLKPQLYRLLKLQREREREIKRLSSRILRYINRRQEISGKKNSAEELRWDLESEFEDVDRTIKLCVF